MSELGRGAASQGVLSVSMAEGHGITVAEWHRLSEAGTEVLRRELLDGELVVKAPMTPAHAECVVRVHQLVEAAVGDAALTQMHLPVVLDDRSEPKPDVSVVERSEPLGPGTRRQVLLLVEVSDSNQALIYSRGRKASYYARSGVPDCWVVDLVAGQVVAHSSPGSSGYREIRNLRSRAELSVTSLPDVTVKVSDILALG